MERIHQLLGDVEWGALLALWGMRVLGAVAVLLAGIWLARLAGNVLRAALDRAHVDSMLSNFLRNAAYAIALVLVVVTALGTLGIPNAPLVATIGAAGLAIGLALQGSLANIAAGVMLIGLRPFRAGDYVKIAGEEGIIVQVRVFQTVIRTFTNHEVVLPNDQIISAPIVNFTALGERRVDVPVGISYDADIREAREVLLRLASDHAKVRSDPAPSVLVNGLGDNSVDLTLRAWVDTADFAGTRSDLVEAIHREFGVAGIGIPYPQRDVRLKFDGPIELAAQATDATDAIADSPKPA